MGQFEKMIAAKQAKAQAALRAKKLAAQEDRTPVRMPAPAAQREASPESVHAELSETCWGLVNDPEPPRQKPPSKLKQPSRLPRQHKAPVRRDRSPPPAAHTEDEPLQEQTVEQAFVLPSASPAQAAIVSPAPRSARSQRSASPAYSPYPADDQTNDFNRRREQQRQYQAELALQIAERKAREEDLKRIQREADTEYLRKVEAQQPEPIIRGGRAQVHREQPREQHREAPKEAPVMPVPSDTAPGRQPEAVEAHSDRHAAVSEEQSEADRKQADLEAWQQEVAQQIASKKARIQAEKAKEAELDRLDGLRIEREQQEMAARYALEVKKVTPRPSDAAKSPVMNSPRAHPTIITSPAVNRSRSVVQSPVALQESPGCESPEEPDSIFGLVAESGGVVHSPVQVSQTDGLRAELEKMRRMAEEAEGARRAAEVEVEALRKALHSKPGAEKKSERRQRVLKDKPVALKLQKRPVIPSDVLHAAVNHALPKKKSTAQRLEEVKARREALDSQKEEELAKVRKVVLSAQKKHVAAAPPAGRKSHARAGRRAPTEPAVRRREQRRVNSPHIERELPSTSRMEKRKPVGNWQGSLVDLGSQMVYRHGADRGCTPEELELMRKVEHGMEKDPREVSMAHGTLMMGIDDWAKNLDQLQHAAIAGPPVSLMPQWDDDDEQYFGNGN